MVIYKKVNYIFISITYMMQKNSKIMIPISIALHKYTTSIIYVKRIFLFGSLVKIWEMNQKSIHTS